MWPPACNPSEQIGGLGGFFPPLVLGVTREATGGYALGFVLLAVFSALCLAVNYFVFIRPRRGGRTLAVMTNATA